MCSSEERQGRGITQRVISYIDAKGMDFAALSSTAGIGVFDADALLEGRRTLVAEEYVSLCELLNVPLVTFMGK